MKWLIYSICILLTIHAIQSAEYIYPVVSYNKGKKVALIWQHSKESIDLLLWDCETNQVEKGLWSLFNPADLTLLPDESGFSFFDNGRLRIKYFHKRSPKTIDFDHCFSALQTLQWLNPSECCCSAKIADFYALFHCTIDGHSCCIASSNNSNYLYSQKINSHVFYIEEQYISDALASYKVMRMDYPRIIPKNNTLCCTQKHAAQTLIDFEHTPVIFLRMISETEGFIIEHARKINTNDSALAFVYHHIIGNNNEWETHKLFSFTIPSLFFTHANENSLYESLLPLIPRTIGTKIYFVDSAYNKENVLNSYNYDIKTAKIKKINGLRNNFFVPMVCGNKIIVGGVINSLNDIQVFNFLT